MHRFFSLIAISVVWFAACANDATDGPSQRNPSALLTDTGSMNTPRANHTATLLPNGTVLVAGGGAGGFPLASAEIFNPATGSFSNTGSMVHPRNYASAVLLSNGKVLVAGGGVFPDDTTAELYDPASGTFAPTATPMHAQRSSFTATRLGDGRVLLTGGIDDSGFSPTSTAEIFDPVGGTFTPVGSMSGPRFLHTATLLPSGDVLITGGYAGAALTGVATAELFHPASGTFTRAATMITPRGLHTATRLPNGTTLIVGGLYEIIGPIVQTIFVSSAELFNSSSMFVDAGTASFARAYHTATLLNDGTVLIVGGDTPNDVLAGMEVYQPASGNFSTVANLNHPRSSHTATLLNNGDVLFAGGIGAGFLSSAEIFHPGGTPPPTVQVAVAPTSITLGQTATLSWSSSSATSCTASGAWSGSQTLSGSQGESPASAGTYVYTLTCTGSGGSSTASATLTVNPTPPPGGGILFFDDFNRTTGLGANWVVANGSFSTNGTAALGTSKSSYAFWIGQPDADGSVSIKLGRPVASTYYGVVARGNPSAPNRDHYVGFVHPNGTLWIARRDAYVYTYLATGPQVPSGTHVLSFSATGTGTVQLSLMLDGVEVLHATDSSASARSSGRVGMFDFNGLSQPLDDFTVRAAGGGGTPDGGTTDGGVTDGGVTDAAPIDGGSEGVVFQDNFNRTGSLGANWVVAKGIFNTNGTAAVATSKSYAFWTGLPDADDTVAIRVGPPIASTYYGVVARGNPSAPDRDHYAGYVLPNGTLGIARRDVYVYSYLATGSQMPSGAHVLSLTATGFAPVQLSLKLDGVEVLHATDSSGSARPSGRVGIFDYNGLSQPLDDFTVTAP